MSSPLPFPVQAFAGPRGYMPMSSHVYALSGNPLTMDDVNRRYAVFNQHLADPIELTRQKPQALAPGLATLNCQGVINLLLHWPGAEQRAATLEQLCVEFGLCPVPDSPFQVWGYYDSAHGALPAHVYLSWDGWIYDTLPGEPVRRTRDHRGDNPPSWCLRHGVAQLDTGHVHGVAVHAFAAGTLATIHAPASAWLPL